MKFDLYKKQREEAQILKNGLKVHKGLNKTNNKPVLMMWKPRAIHPYVHYYFNTDYELEIYLDKKVNQYNEWLQYKAERKQARNGNFDKVKIGDIFHHSWGYEQTQCDFYQVIEKSAASLEVLGVELKVPKTPFLKLTYDEVIKIINSHLEEKMQWGDDLGTLGEHTVGNYVYETTGESHYFKLHHHR